MTHKHRKKLIKFLFFEVLDVLFWGLKASSVAWTSNLPFWIKKRKKNFLAVFVFFSFWLSKPRISIRIWLLVGCRTVSDSMGYMLISLHAKPDPPAYCHLKADPASDRGYAFTVEVKIKFRRSFFLKTFISQNFIISKTFLWYGTNVGTKTIFGKFRNQNQC